MKKLILTSLALSLLFSSCTDDNDNIPENNSSEIKMNATVKSTTVRSGPINGNFTEDFPIGVYAYNSAWKAGSTNVINNDNSTVAGAASHDITFDSGPYYYPSDGTTVSFFAFAPQATETTAATAGTSPIVTHTITGKQDVMWASATGYKSGSADAVHPQLNFQHVLTQLQFIFKSDATYPATGNTVVSLTVKAQPTLVNMVVGTGVCTFATNADMPAFTATTLPSGVNIATAGTNANSPIMTSAASSYLFDIVVKPATGAPNVTYSNVSLTLTTVAGSAHQITFTFSETVVTATATVANWIAGTGGAVSVL